MAWTKEIPANPVVAVAGATGAVGREFLEVLHDLDFPASEVRALASSRLAGKKLPFKGCGQVPAGDLIVEDYNIRKYLKNKLYSAGIAKIEIERNNDKVKINIHCSRPGVVIGKGGADIENLRKEMEKRLGKAVALNIIEIRSPDLNAQLVAENIAAQLEKRISFRRAMIFELNICLGKPLCNPRR